MWLMLAMASALAGSCDLSSPPDAPFAIPAPAEASRVRLLLELWVDADHIDWARGVLSELNAREVPGILAVAIPDEPPSPLQQISKRFLKNTLDLTES